MTFQDYLQILEKADYLQPPNQQSKKNPFLMDARELAIQLNLIYEHNARTNLPGQSKDDPESLPMSIMNTVAEIIDIPKALHALQQGTKLQSSDEQQEQGSESDDRQVLALLPVATRRSMKYQGLDIDELPPVSGNGENTFYGATGRQIQHNEVTRRELRTLFLTTPKSRDRLNAALHKGLTSVFSNLDELTDLSQAFPAAHMLQMLLILLANKTFHEKMDILMENALIGTTVLTTSADLSRFITSITSASVLENIINFDLPFAPNKKLVHQAIQGVSSVVKA